MLVVPVHNPPDHNLALVVTAVALCPIEWTVVQRVNSAPPAAKLITKRVAHPQAVRLPVKCLLGNASLQAGATGHP